MIMKRLILIIALFAASLSSQAQSVKIYNSSSLELAIDYMAGNVRYYSSSTPIITSSIDTTYISLSIYSNGQYSTILRPTDHALILKQDSSASGATFAESLSYIDGIISQAVQTRKSQVLVNQSNYASTLSSIDNSKEYFIDGTVYLNGNTISIPSGINVKGYDFNTSILIDTTDNYTMFSGGGNVLIEGVDLRATGASSKVFDLTGTSTEAIEMNRMNFTACTSLGQITDYRQYLESGTGRFGGTPELTLDGDWNGVRVTTSIARGISNITALFQAGETLTLDGRFITDINCDLPAVGALIDFDTSNIVNDESLIIQGAYITRSGVLNSGDESIMPNIKAYNTESNWKGNTGLANTKKYIKSTITSEAATTISLVNTYYPIAGVWTVSDSSHFREFSNGVYELLSGNGSYQIVAEIVLASSANNEIDIRVTKSTDGGSTFPTEVNHIKRTVNNLSGGRDVAFFPINFIATLKDGDMIRFEVENKTGANNATAEVDSYIIITEI